MACYAASIRRRFVTGCKYPSTPVPGGIGAAATRCGGRAHAGGVLADGCDAPASVYVTRNVTPDGAPTDLFHDGTSYSFRSDIPNKRARAVDMLVVGRSDTGLSKVIARLLGMSVRKLELVPSRNRSVGEPSVVTLRNT